MNKQEARNFLRTQSGNVWSAILELSMKELEAVKELAAAYSTTNCWYAEYYMKDAFLNLINDRIEFLKSQTIKTG